MTETTAAIACTQLGRAKKIIASRIELAQELSDMFAGVPWIMPPSADIGCKHVYYLWAATVEKKRDSLVRLLVQSGFPMRRGYSPLLSTIFIKPGEKPQPAPVASLMEHKELMTFEICAYDPRWRQRKQMREIARQAIDAVS